MQSGQKLWEETVALYERATSTFLKNNLLLHFAYADFEEVGKLLSVNYINLNYSYRFLSLERPFAFNCFCSEL
jgi:hypothetical protein